MKSHDILPELLLLSQMLPWYLSLTDPSIRMIQARQDGREKVKGCQRCKHVGIVKKKLDDFCIGGVHGEVYKYMGMVKKNVDGWKSWNELVAKAYNKQGI